MTVSPGRREGVWEATLWGLGSKKQSACVETGNNPEHNVMIEVMFLPILMSLNVLWVALSTVTIKSPQN